MSKPPTYLTDSFGRVHNYLRISLTEHCNLRCFYCMPEEGLAIQPKSEYLSTEEILEVAQTMVTMGVNKIRLTGGEPLIRKDFEFIARSLAAMPIELALTTNAILVDQYIDLFKEIGLTNINVSLDSLDADKNLLITKRDYYDRIRTNIQLLIDNGIVPKLNVVVMRGINDNEVIDFIELTRSTPMEVRFIEFMPFNGNQWERDKCFSYNEVMDLVRERYGEQGYHPVISGPNSTSKNFYVEDYQGNFGVISSITAPFCSGCNRIRLTADGKLKNCLFSSNEFDVRTPLRAGEDIQHAIVACISAKKAVRAGLDADDESIDLLEENRSMISIGG